MINTNILELIVTSFNLSSHKKYFEVMKKYRDYAIITIEDDIIYTNDLIESLYNSYLKNPNCIHARCVHKISIKNNKILPYDKWFKEYSYEINPSFNLFPISKGGILFPPDILNISDENIKEISEFLEFDDIYIKYLSRKRNIKIVWIPNNFCLGLKQLQRDKTSKQSLYKKKINEKLKDKNLNIFPNI